MDYEEPTAIGKPREAVFRSAEKYALEVGFLPGDRIEPLISRLGGSIVYLGVLDRPDGLNEIHGPKALKRPHGNEAHDGSLFVDGPRDFRILVSAFTGPERDRFTIAHELGHYVLHSSCGQRRIRASRFGSNPVEWEANWFAAAFLMPKADFKATVRRFKGDSALIAARYLVSQKAAEVRMRSLGLSS